MKYRLPRDLTCRNKVIIEISVQQLIELRIIFGSLKSREDAFNNLLSGLKKIRSGKESNLDSDEKEAINDAVNHPENFSDDFNNFFDNYSFISSLVSYSEDD
jgi:hypothetical protein